MISGEYYGFLDPLTTIKTKIKDLPAFLSARLERRTLKPHKPFAF